MNHFASSSALVAAAFALLAPPSAAQVGTWKVVPLLPTTANLKSPTCMAVAKDGRFFITERTTGRIRIYDWKNRTLLATPFASVTGTNSSGERGLLGIALDPAFPTTPHVYAYQTYRSGTVTYGRILRFTARGNVAVAVSTILDKLPTSTNHNGGVLAFGPDGKLYFPIGDTRVPKTSQNKSATVWAGKMHRINKDGTIPSDNPFGSANPQFALGIRNAFGLAFHPLDRRLYEVENGPTTNDEVQILRPGGNYGWPVELGNQNKPGYDKPIYTWTPCIAPCGTAFSRSNVYPSTWLHSLWVCDYVFGKIRILRFSGQWHDKVRSETILPAATYPTDIKQGPDGKMYFCSMYRGQIYRIDWTGTAPVLPEFLVTGPMMIGTRNWLHLRARPRSVMVVITGTPLSPPRNTPWGILRTNPLLVFGAGVCDENGVSSFLMPIPSVASLKGIRFRLQGGEITPSFTIRLANAVDLVIL